MARLVDVDNPQPGYFWTSSFEEVITFTQNYLSLYNHSINFLIHGSSLFTKDDETEEIHMSPSGPIILDPSMEDIANRLELLYDEIHDPEAWQGLRDSSWIIIPCTFTYWFKIIPFQPNNKPKENDKNRWDPPDFDNPDDPSQPPDNNQLQKADVGLPEYDSLLQSIALYYHGNKSRMSKVRLYPYLCKFLESEKIYPNTYFGKISPGNIAHFHETVGKYNLQIFSEFGNVIYEKKYEPGDYINILWSNRKFKLITNLNALLSEKSDRHFCSLCKKFHRSDQACKDKIIPADTETVDVPSFPEGRHALVQYADFESIVLPNKEHKCSGYGFVIIDKDKHIINEMYENKLENDKLTESFIVNSFKAAEQYAFDTIQYMGGGDVIGLIAGTIIANETKKFFKRFKKTYKCQICDEEIGDNERYVQGTNFINGLNGRHHKDCWEDTKNALMCYFHNFKGYDSHYILQELMKDTRYECKFIRGKSFEKFDIISATTTSKDGHLLRITFKDTFNYLATSIAKLVTQVNEWKYTPEKDRNSKGTFPYKWFNDFKKLSDKELPPDCEWFNDITHTNIDPKPAHEIWNREKFSTFGEFHNYYMKTDILQLADIFEEFRESCISSFNLDPVYFQGAPSLTWQLNLMQSADKMFLINDINIYQDIQANIRGGIAQVMHRYVNIENKPNESMLFLDVNSLYSKCMTYKLPTKYIRTITLLPHDWQQIYAEDGDLTALLCVDLEYPTYLHDLHTAYPLAPHKYNGRLCTTFLPKRNYLIHAKVLKFYLNEGLRISKFHYGYLFYQDYILKDYVENNIIKRRTSKSPPLQTLYKLLNNSLYGKTCENKFKYRKFEVYKEDNSIFGKINTWLMDTTNWLPINDKVLIEKKIKEIKLDKPIQIGFSILDFAKLEMYKFLFAIQNIFKEDVQPLYTDTDSILIHFKHPHPEEVLFNDPTTRPFLDFDKIPEHWTVHTPGTHKESGLWSLETTDKIIEFIGIRAKTYSYRTENKEILKNKGITATAIELKTREKITMEHYRQALFENKEIKVYQVTIGSKKHQLLTKKQIKLAITNNDEKRHVLPDKITTIPYGYKGEKFADYIIHKPELSEHV